MLIPLDAIPDAPAASVPWWPVVLLIIAAVMVVFFIIVQLRRILRSRRLGGQEPRADEG